MKKDKFNLKEQAVHLPIDAIVDEKFDLDGSIRQEDIRVKQSRQRLDDISDELSSIPSRDKRQ